MTATFAHELGAFVQASIEEDPDLLVIATNHDDRVAPEGGGVVVACLCNLALVADVEPGTLEDARELGFKDVCIDVDRVVHRVRAHAAGEVGRFGVYCHGCWYTKNTLDVKYTSEGGCQFRAAPRDSPGRPATGRVRARAP